MITGTLIKGGYEFGLLENIISRYSKKTLGLSLKLFPSSHPFHVLVWFSCLLLTLSLHIFYSNSVWDHGCLAGYVSALRLCLSLQIISYLTLGAPA